MQNIDQHVGDLERILSDLAGTIKANNISRGIRRKLMKAQASIDRASSILASLAEDEAEPKKEPKVKKPKAAKKPAAKKSA